MPSSKELEIRNKLLDADPDGIDWKHEAKDDDAEIRRAPRGWYETIARMFNAVDSFHGIIGPETQRHLKAVAAFAPGQNVHADEVVKAQLEVLKDLVELRREMVRKALRQLAAAGVPAEMLKPQWISQHWGASEAHRDGRLVMRLRMWVTRNPAREVVVEERRRWRAVKGKGRIEVFR